MTDRRGQLVTSATWQPSDIASAGTSGTYVLGEYRNGTANATPIVTANGWTLDSGTLANNVAATLRQENLTSAPSSPVLVASDKVRSALGVGFATATADWGVDRIAW
jgi:hypothetical protein